MTIQFIELRKTPEAHYSKKVSSHHLLLDISVLRILVFEES